MTNQPYRYIPVNEFAEAFQSYHIGRKLANELSVPYDKARSHPAALETEKYGLTKKELLKACFSREMLLFKRSAFVHVFATVQVTSPSCKTPSPKNSSDLSIFSVIVPKLYKFV
jgi:hypothetical protein